MNTPWRLFLAALRFVTHRSTSPDDSSRATPQEAARFLPLVGILLGLWAGAIYWVGSQLWPTSVAVILCMLATALLEGRAAGVGTPYGIFVIIIQYNALMALSAAHVPMALPPYLALGLIMVAGQAASRALVVSVMATDSGSADASANSRPTLNDLALALFIGLSPAGVLGIPGLIGLVAAILVRLLLTAALLPRLRYGYRERLDVTQRLTEASFYLGALATWKYV